MKTWITIVTTLIMALLAPIASAGQLAAVSIINQATGERLPIWRHQGVNYVAGKPGDRYAIEIRNKTDERVLSVLSVDGINVLTGSTASPAQAGYVLNTWQTMEVKGWRKNMDEVAAFYFSQLPDSYAARTGRPDNVGVIGIALFREYVEPAYVRQEEYSRNSAATAQAPVPSSAPAITGSMAKRADGAELADSRIGTGHGERLPSAVRSTDFRRATPMANEIISIRYDTYAHLVARGIIPRTRHDQPNPFPGGFVPDPD